MANKPIQFILKEQKLNIGKQAGKTVIVARPTGRQRVDFRNFCERIAKSTTFDPQEVAAVLNLASETARDIVANGDIVEFGDLGTLTPSFKSKAVLKGEQFRAQQHIEKPVVKLLASRKYFTLNDVTFEQVTPGEKKAKTEKKTEKKKKTQVLFLQINKDIILLPKTSNVKFANKFKKVRELFSICSRTFLWLS